MRGSTPALPWLLLGAAVLGSALLFGCSSAGPFVLSGDRDVRQAAESDGTRAALDLAPPGRHVSSGRLEGVRAADAHPSPDGKWIAFEADRSGTPGIWLARPDGEEPRPVSDSRPARLPRWSPDSRRLMFLVRACRTGACGEHQGTAAGKWEIWIAEPAGGAPRQVVPAAPEAGAAWFPDSRHICYGSGAWLTVLDTDTGAMRSFRLQNDGGRLVGVPAVSPDGQRVVFAVEGQGAWVASIADGAMQQVLSQHDVDAFAWAPGGRQIAFRDARDGQWKVKTVK